MTAKHVASHFSEVFGEYGWQDTLLTDNGPCYASHEFKQVMLDMSVNHITSSPHYPQSNGLAEKYVQIVKNLFVKAYEEGTDYQKALMIYRNTPLDDNLTSLMRILQGRTARSDLPMSYAAKVKFGLASSQPSLLRPEKNECAPTHDYKLNQDVMYLDPVSNKWFLLHYGSTNPMLNGSITGHNVEQMKDVRMYIEEFILVDIWIHCCTSWK